jgi:hypothetical protein
MPEDAALTERLEALVREVKLDIAREVLREAELSVGVEPFDIEKQMARAADIRERKSL